MRTQLVGPLFLLAALTLPLAACNNDDKGESESNAGTTEGGCTPGERGCECNAEQCLGDLQCVAGMCVSSCIPGELGCSCNGGQCLSGLECVSNLCTDPNCIPGELACECNNGQCLGDLECVGNVCLEGSSTGDGDGDGDGDPTGDGDGDPTGDGDGDPTGDGDGDPTGDGDGDPECPNANEMMCNGQCIDVMANDNNCGGCGVECLVHVGGIGICVDGECTPTWSTCVPMSDGYMTCNEICAVEGNTCVAQGCGGNTFLMISDVNLCNNGQSGNKNGIDCDGVIGWQANWGACCCTQ